MSAAARRPFVVGNWKMHLGPREGAALALALRDTDTSADVALAPMAITIPAVVAALRDSGVHVAAQDLHPASAGAFTGALSGSALREAGCSYVIVGHSERRMLFGEDDALIHQKVHAALREGLLPILCVGEQLEQRAAGLAEATVLGQLQAGLAGLAADQVVAVTVAYEPVWAIGTGLTASPEQAQQMHATLRRYLAATYPSFVAIQTRIQYGGSVKPDNAAALLAQPDIDGALVGGASLSASSFRAILDACSSRG